MFTGIVETKGFVSAVTETALGIDAPSLTDLSIGGSISVSGACLSITSLTGNGFTVDVVPETRRRTNLGQLSAGSAVNLERPVPAAGRLDGHIVQGHVDGTAAVSSITPDGDSKIVRMELDPSLARYAVEKGFIAVDGVSLTVIDCGQNWLSVAIVPITASVTTLGDAEVGDPVNIEVDILAKYVERFVSSSI